MRGISHLRASFQVEFCSSNLVVPHDNLPIDVTLAVQHLKQLTQHQIRVSKTFFMILFKDPEFDFNLRSYYRITMESDDKSSTQPFEENSLLNLEEMSAENQRQADEADSLINNSAIQAIVDKVIRDFYILCCFQPPLLLINSCIFQFNLDNFAKNHPLADDIENSVRELIKENIKLKGTSCFLLFNRILF